MGRRGIIVATVVVAVALACGVVAFLALRGSDDPTPRAEAAPTTQTPSSSAPAPTPDTEPEPEPVCTALGPFPPERIVIPGVLEAEVVPVPRDDRDVTGVLPLSDKTRFAWDMPPGIQPGQRRGNVLLNTHTWSDGSAAGNALLDGLEEGMRIVLRGSGQRQCYDVEERIEVPASEGFPAYYEDDGPHRVAIIVCSGERTGPGEWSHRTIWFARAVA